MGCQFWIGADFGLSVFNVGTLATKKTSLNGIDNEGKSVILKSG
jgi:hypothetical protein